MYFVTNELTRNLCVGELQVWEIGCILALKPLTSVEALAGQPTKVASAIAWFLKAPVCHTEYVHAYHVFHRPVPEMHEPAAGTYIQNGQSLTQCAGTQPLLPPAPLSCQNK